MSEKGRIVLEQRSGAVVEHSQVNLRVLKGCGAISSIGDGDREESLHLRVT